MTFERVPWPTHHSGRCRPKHVNEPAILPVAATREPLILDNPACRTGQGQGQVYLARQSQ
jgi:hypothetical protein